MSRPIIVCVRDLPSQASWLEEGRMRLLAPPVEQQQFRIYIAAG